MPLTNPEEYRDDKEAVGAETNSASETGASTAEESEYSSSGLLKDSKAHTGDTSLKHAPQNVANNLKHPTATGEMSKVEFIINSTKAALGSKKAWLRLGTAGGILGLIIAAFFAFSVYELVHVSENIKHSIDKRLEHSIPKRIGMNGWKKIKKLARKDKPAGIADPDHPLKNAYEQFDFSKLEADTGYKATFDTSGKWTGLTSPEGKHISADSAALGDETSPMRQLLSNRYPELGFFHDNISARNLDAEFDVKRKFLDDPEDPGPTDDKAIKEDLDKRADARIADTDTSGSRTKSEEDKAKGDIKSAADSVDGHGFINKVKSLIPGFNEAAKICGVNGLAKALHDGLIVVRRASEIRLAFVVISTADKIKTGHVKLKQVGVMMRELSGFYKSSSFRKITGDKHAKVSLAEQKKFSADGGGAIANVAGFASSSGTVNSLCKVVNGPIGLITGVVIAGVEAMQPEAAGLLEGLTAATTSYVGQIAIGKIGEELVKVAISAQGPVIDWVGSSGADKVTGAIAGWDHYENAHIRASGGMEASAAAVAEMDNEADQDAYRRARSHGVMYAMFSPTYINSITNRVALRIPGTPEAVADQTGSTLAAVFSPFNGGVLDAFKRWFSGTAAQADSTSDDPTGDPTGMRVKQQIIPDWLIEKYPNDTDNEQWVIDYLAGKGQRLYEPGTDPNDELVDKTLDHDDDYHKWVKKCLISQDPDEYNDSECDAPAGPNNISGPNDAYNHFRLYRFDTANGNYIHSFNNKENDQNDPDGAGGSTGGAATAVAASGSLPTGDEQALAKDILKHSGVTYEADTETDMRNAANGQPGTCNVKLSKSLLQILDYMAQSHSYRISALESSCGHHSGGPGDPHYQGRAADITQVDGDPIVMGAAMGAGGGRTANDVKVMREIAPLMPPSTSATWQEQSAFGQQGCGPEPDPKLPSGIVQFGDACNHLHIQVAQ